jgi:hypothetical protein
MRKLTALVLFVVISLVIAIPRLNMPSVWTDTGIKIVMKQGTAANMVDPDKDNHSTGYPVGASVNVWRDSPSMSRYAPITSWQVAEQLKCSDMPSIVLIAVMWGILASMIYLLALEITKKNIIAMGAALLYSLSIPGIQIAWTLYNTQPLIELLIVLGLYAYTRYRKTNQLRWYLLLLATCVVAPLVRELAIIVPLVVLSATVIDKKWDKKILITFPIILLYNIFPSTIPNLFFGKLLAISVFSRGAPRLYLNNFGISQQGLEMSSHLLLYVSPILILLTTISVAMFIGKRLEKQGRYIVMGFMGLCFASLFFTGLLTIFTIILFVVMAVASFNLNKILAIWLIISWFPFLWLYNGADTILAASAIPLAIIMMRWIYRLFASIKRTKLASTVYATCLLLGFVSLPLNLVAVNKTFIGNDAITREMSSWLKANISQNSIVISNLIHGEELQDFADGWFDHYYGFSMPSFPFDVASPTEYVKLVKDTARDVYLVAGLSLPDGANHWLLNQDGITVSPMKEFVMSEGYPVSDPLKTILPPSRRPYGGAPDLVNEIVVNNITPFSQQSYAKYGIYKIDGVE